ncbi:MAG TPA: glycosyltransferase family 39 protein [Candidatus Acidoferrum sp.]|nr:glycosyltransferase family 39 protein [Candidatus Acidoferrum sp.]
MTASQTTSAPATSLSRSPARFFASAPAFALVALVWLLIYIPALAQPGLLDDADSIHAEAAREMVLNHNWVTLYINGIRYLEKSPLMYWSVASSYKLFGVDEWQTRLPLALGVLGLAWCAFIFGRRYFGTQGGFYAALILVTAPGIYVYTRFLIPDVLVAMWLTLGLYFFLIAYEQERPSHWLCWGVAVTIALNVLTKSLIGIVFPGMIIGAFLLLTGGLRKILKFHLISSAVVFLIVAAPWHILAALRSPAQPSGPEKGFLWFYFVNEQFLRYLNKRVPYDYDKVPLLLFWALLLAWLVPWFVYLFPALGEIPRHFRAWRDGLDARARANLFCGIWAAVIMLFFSFSTRQEYYSLPALPALALLTGGWLARESESPAASSERRAGRIASAALLVIGALAFAAAMTVLAKTHPFPQGTDIGDVLTPHPGAYKLSLGHMGDLTLESFGLFRRPLWLVGIGLLVGTGLNWICRRRGRALAGNLALAAMMVVVLFCVHDGLVIFSPELSSKRIALQIEKAYRPGDTIVINGKYEWGSTLNYYTGIQLHVLNGRDGNLWFGSFFPGAPQIFEDDASFAQLWNGPNRVFLFSEDFLADSALAHVDRAKVFVFARQGGKVVLTNQPVP